MNVISVVLLGYQARFFSGELGFWIRWVENGIVPLLQDPPAVLRVHPTESAYLSGELWAEGDIFNVTLRSGLGYQGDSLRDRMSLFIPTGDVELRLTRNVLVWQQLCLVG